MVGPAIAAPQADGRDVSKHGHQTHYRLVLGWLSGIGALVIQSGVTPSANDTAVAEKPSRTASGKA